MSNIRPIADILRELKERYDKDKKGWRVFAGKDRRGRHDMFIGHRSHLWQLKMEEIKPYRYIGYGAKIGKVPFLDAKRLRSGRPVFFELLSPQRDGSVIVATGVQSYSSRAILGLKALISERQRELDLRLSKELDKLIYRRYPQFAMYV